MINTDKLKEFLVENLRGVFRDVPIIVIKNGEEVLYEYKKENREEK